MPGTYSSPSITDFGTVADLTAAKGGGKNGFPGMGNALGKTGSGWDDMGPQRSGNAHQNQKK